MNQPLHTSRILFILDCWSRLNFIMYSRAEVSQMPPRGHRSSIRLEKAANLKYIIYRGHQITFDLTQHLPAEMKKMLFHLVE